MVATKRLARITGSIVLPNDDLIASEFLEFAARRPQLPSLAVVVVIKLTAMPSINWTAFFNSRHDNVIGNKNTTAYTEAWAQDKNHDVKMSLLNNDANTVVLAANSNDTILFLHSFKNIGGTPLLPTNKYVCFLGANDNASAVIINPQTITADVNLRTPTHTDILACANIAELAALANPANNAAITYPGCATFLPAPWLVDAILAAGTNKPLDTIIAAKAAATNFDTAHAADPTYVTSARDHLEDFVLWAWGVAKGRVARVGYTFDPDDEDLARYKATRIHQCILPAIPPPILHQPFPIQAVPPPPGGAPPNFAQGMIPQNIVPPPANPNDAILLQLANSISRQTEEAEIHNELITRQMDYAMERDDKKKDRLKKLHPSVKQLLIFASAEDAETVPDDALDSCKRFMNAETEGVADQELNIQFKSLNLHDAAFSIGFTQALYNGKFLWSDRSTPSNFSPFSISEIEPLLVAEQQNRHFVLHIIQTQGKGRTVDEIKASNKQVVKAPTSYSEMIQQLRYFAGACRIFFGEFSVATTSINALMDAIDKHKHIFKAREAGENEFVSKFLFAVDTRMQLWLEDCSTLTSRDQVDDSTLDFTALVNSVRLGNFDAKLPSTFSKTDTNSSDNKKRSNNTSSSGPSNRQGDEETAAKKTKRIGVKSPSQPDAFKMKTGETWAATFASKKIEPVAWEDDIAMCPRWFICGRCFSNCPSIKSHVGASDIPEAKLTAFTEYMKKCRSASSN